MGYQTDIRGARLVISGVTLAKIEESKAKIVEEILQEYFWEKPVNQDALIVTVLEDDADETNQTINWLVDELNAELLGYVYKRIYVPSEKAWG